MNILSNHAWVAIGSPSSVWQKIQEPHTFDNQLNSIHFYCIFTASGGQIQNPHKWVIPTTNTSTKLDNYDHI